MKGELTRERALKALNALFDTAFGCDKGSDDAYRDFCEILGLCELWDGEESLTKEHEPPGQYEILEAAHPDHFAPPSNTTPTPCTVTV